MSPDDEKPSTPAEVPADARKPWSKPEIRDQSVTSLTQAKPNANPTEASPGTGS